MSGGGSRNANNWAWNLDLPMTHKFLLIALCDKVDENNSCFPGQESLAHDISASVSTVRRAIKDLETWGLLERVRRQRESDGLRTSDRYFVKVGKTLPVNLTGKELPVNSGELPVNSGELPVNGEQALTTSTSTSTSTSLGKLPTKPARGTRVPEDFPVSAAMREWAGANAPSANVDVETAKFVDHWKSTPGAKGLKSDWLAAWRNWLRISHQWEVGRGWKAPEPIHRFGRGDNDAA